MLCACFVWDNKNFGSMLVLKLKLFSGKLLPVYSFFFQSLFFQWITVIQMIILFCRVFFVGERAILQWFLAILVPRQQIKKNNDSLSVYMLLFCAVVLPT